MGLMEHLLVKCQDIILIVKQRFEDSPTLEVVPNESQTHLQLTHVKL